MAPNPSQSFRGICDTIIVLGDHSDVGVLSDDNESAPEEALDVDDAFEEVSQATKRKATSLAPKTPKAKKRHSKSETSSPLIKVPTKKGITDQFIEILLLYKKEELLNLKERSFRESI
jgi:hypothetical protein